MNFCARSIAKTTFELTGAFGHSPSVGAAHFATQNYDPASPPPAALRSLFVSTPSS